MEGLSPVDRALLACLSWDAAAFSALRTPVDMAEVVARAQSMGLAPLLYDRLRQRGLTTVLPEGLERDLSSRARGAVLEGAQLYRWVGRVLRALCAAAVDVIPLKGAYLAEQVYRDVGLRPMSDIDLLIHRDQVEAAQRALAALGYTLAEKNTPEYVEGCSHYRHDAPPGGIPVEVHWSIQGGFDPFRIDMDALWERSGPLVIAGVEVRALSPEDGLLHLILHTSHHHLFAFGLRSLYDIGVMVERYAEALDWGRLTERARAWGAGRSARLTLWLAQQWLGVPVPDTALNALAPAEVDATVLSWARAHLLPTETGAPPAEPEPERDLAAPPTEGPISNYWGRMHAATGAAKLRVFLEACFPPRATLAARYSLPPDSWRVYPGYVAHIGGLVSRHALRALKLALHDPETERWAAGESLRLEREARQEEIRRLRDWLAGE